MRYSLYFVDISAIEFQFSQIRTQIQLDYSLTWEETERFYDYAVRWKFHHLLNWWSMDQYHDFDRNRYNFDVFEAILNGIEREHPGWFHEISKNTSPLFNELSKTDQIKSMVLGNTLQIAKRLIDVPTR